MTQLKHSILECLGSEPSSLVTLTLWVTIKYRRHSKYGLLIIIVTLSISVYVVEWAHSGRVTIRCSEVNATHEVEFPIFQEFHEWWLFNLFGLDHDVTDFFVVEYQFGVMLRIHCLAECELTISIWFVITIVSPTEEVKLDWSFDIVLTQVSLFDSDAIPFRV